MWCFRLCKNQTVIDVPYTDLDFLFSFHRKSGTTRSNPCWVHVHNLYEDWLIWITLVVYDPKLILKIQTLKPYLNVVVQDPSLQNYLIWYQNICNSFNERMISNTLSEVQAHYLCMHPNYPRFTCVYTVCKRIWLIDYIYVTFVNTSMKN